MKKKQNIQDIATDTLRCALSWDPEACLIGNVTAWELARLAAAIIQKCPDCGALSWGNVDCILCRIFAKEQ